MTPRLPASAPAGPVFVHSDALHSRLLVPRSHDREQLLASHLATLGSLSDGRDLWLPAFNYDFVHTLRFDVEADESQVGPISETFRRGPGAWRTLVPVFSISGTGPPPPLATALPDLVDPFGDDSMFARHAELDGIVLWYGAPFGTTTFLHRVERASGGPVYRYDKDFAGTVVTHERTHHTVLRYHLYPLGRPLRYDWDRLLRRAADAGVVREVEGTGGVCLWAPADALGNHLLEAVAADPLDFLDGPSRDWVAPILERLGRRFELRDFEADGSTPGASVET